MKKIIVLGAGRSSSALISYLIKTANTEGWHVTVGDTSITNARERVGANPKAAAIEFNIENTEESRKAIQNSDVVISLMPASLHPLVAKICLSEKKHLLT
ncbi:MAG TPA: saccharopine dehydrogenase, partial [Cytophagales bacterium]|nr:saccharopine dehydrogenase [Cytophagales bacterium]